MTESSKMTTLNDEKAKQIGLPDGFLKTAEGRPIRKMLKW